MVGSAGFLGWKPIVPDRAAFGAASEGETKRGQAQQQQQPTKHLEKLLPVVCHHTAQGLLFSSRPQLAGNARTRRSPRTAFLQVPFQMSFQLSWGWRFELKSGTGLSGTR